MIYINAETKQGKETVDEFSSAKEAIAMCKEYRLADKENRYYVSPRPCDNWKDKK